MTETVCAVVVTYNRKGILPACLQSLAAQTRPIDHIVVVNNASTDGTGEMLAHDFPAVHVLTQEENSGGAGGFRAGMKWACDNGFDWVWIMDDDVEALPDALATLLGFGGIADLIQGRKSEGGRPLIWESLWDASSCSTMTYSDDLSFKNGKPWASISYANFEGSLIKRKVMEKVGYPDPRYFIASDDTIYGFIVSLHFQAIYINRFTMCKHAEPPATRNRIYYYFHLRNRFLNYEHFRAAGVPVRRKLFIVQSLLMVYSLLSEIVRKPKERKLSNIRTVFLAFRDGINGRYGRPTWIV